MKAVIFTKEQEQYLRDNYATASRTELRAYLGMGNKVIHSKANRMGLHKNLNLDTLRQKLIELSATGYMNADVTSHKLATVRATTDKLRAKGLVFGSTVKRRGQHYFDTAEKAAAYTAAYVHPGPKPYKRKAVPKAPKPTKHLVPKATRALRAGWGPDDPAHITPETRYYVAPPPPERPLKTNTHWHF